MQNILAHYGLEPVSSKKLDGYDSLNHKIQTEKGTFVLKIYKSGKEFEIAKAEEAILKKITPDMAIALPLASQPLFTHDNKLHDANNPNTDIAKKIKEGLKSNYILTSTDGPHDNVLKIKPPMCFSAENADTLTTRLEELLKVLN